MKVRVERINRYATKAGKHRTANVGLPLNAMAGRVREASGQWAKM